MTKKHDLTNTTRANYAKRASTDEHSEFFNRITGSISEGLEAIAQGHQLTVREVEMPEPPRPLKPSEIARLRRKLNVSQTVFAGMLNASVQTVRAWEQGLKVPSGPSLRLLEIARYHPETLIKPAS